MKKLALVTAVGIIMILGFFIHDNFSSKYNNDTSILIELPSLFNITLEEAAVILPDSIIAGKRVIKNTDDYSLALAVTGDSNTVNYIILFPTSSNKCRYYSSEKNRKIMLNRVGIDPDLLGQATHTNVPLADSGAEYCASDQYQFAVEISCLRTDRDVVSVSLFAKEGCQSE